MLDEAHRFGDAVASYLKPYRLELKDYAWPMSKHARDQARELGFTLGDSNGGAASTHELRSAVARRVKDLHILSETERSAKLAELSSFVIRVWGGLGSNRDETIELYANAFPGTCPADLSAIRSAQDLRAHTGCAFPLKGISSWSKWLNFIWSDWALIYDARIAFALNAIHFRERVDAPAFRVPEGRDALLSKIDTQSIAALRYLKRRGGKRASEISENKMLVAWLESGLISQDETYEYYLLVMQRAREVLAKDAPLSLVETEMLLFYLSNRSVVRDLLESIASVVE